MTAYWLTHSTNQVQEGKNETGEYLGVYSGILLTGTLLTFVRAVVYVTASIQCSRYA